MATAGRDNEVRCVPGACVGVVCLACPGLAALGTEAVEEVLQLALDARLHAHALQVRVHLL